jgi:hypothetical protein
MNILTVNLLFSTLVFWLAARIYLLPILDTRVMMQRKDDYMADSELAEYCSSDVPVIARLAMEVRRLREGIRNHRSQTGHSLCWLNDVALWRLIEEETAYPHDTLPVREEFLANCERYYQSRLEGTPWTDPAVKHTITGDE